MPNEKRPRDKGDVKTEGVKGNSFKRKRSQNKSVNQPETRKMVPSENRVKRMRCGEKRMSREESLKKKRCLKIRMPRERDVNGQRLKRHRFQETAMTPEKTCQERRVCQISGFSAVDKKGCQDSETSGASRIKRKWTKMSRIQKRQGQRLPRDHGGHSRASQAVRRRSYRPSLVFIGSSLCRNFRHLACPGSTCIHPFSQWPGSAVS